jgi:DNA repair protein RadC
MDDALYAELPLFENRTHYYVRSQLVREKEMPHVKISSSSDAAKYIREQIGDYDREVILAIALNARNSVNATSIVHIGSGNESVADTADIVRVALNSCSRNLIIAHNHPSGEPSPSTEDQAITKRLKEAASLLGIKLMDHIIIGDDAYYSFADEGLLA